MHSTPQARRGWRKRLSLLAFLSLLLALPIGLVAQTPALASVSVSVFAGNGTAGFSGDGGAATSAELNQPEGVAADGVGNVYIFDNLNKRIREVDSSGKINTAIGDGTSCSTNPNLTNSLGPDQPGVCSSSYPVGFGTSQAGELFFANNGLDDLYGAVAHVAGKVTGSYSPGDTSGTNDAFSVSVAPGALAAQDHGTVYFAESSTSGWPGNSIKEWQQMDTTTNPMHSTVKTIAGMSGTGTCNYYPAFSNDGHAAAGVCIHPYYIAYWNGYVYFFDTSPGYQGPTLWKVNVASGNMYHIAGNGSSSNSGSDGSLAVNDGFSNIGPIAVDSSGNVYFGSAGGGLVREVDTSGKLWHITDLGTAQSAYAFDGANNLYIAEPSNNEVVKVSGLGSITHQGNLVTLGDSVAAGEGINYGWRWDGQYWNSATETNTPTWYDTSAATGTNYSACHQTQNAYSRYLYEYYTVYNMACTGAGVATGILKGYTLTDPDNGNSTTTLQQLGWGGSSSDCSWCDSPSTEFDGHNPDVVLLTVGADDVNFEGWVKKCYGDTTACGSTDDTNQLNSDLSTAESNLRLVLTELNRWAGTKSKTLKVLVTDYFDPFQSTYAQCADTSGAALLQTYPWIGITSGEQSWLQLGLSTLNSNISAEVSYAKVNDLNLDAQLVDISDAAAGHEYCTSDPWVYGPSIDYPAIGNGPGNSPAPFHPTPALQYAIYQKVKAALGL